MASIASTLGHKVNSIPKPDPRLAIPDAKVGIEVEVENWRTSKQVPSEWLSKEDGSLRNNGREFITNGGLVGTQIFQAIDSICKYCTETKCSIGYPRAGIHIHLDCTDLNDKNPLDLWHLCQAYMLVEHMMFGFCTQVSNEEKSEWRRWTGYCDSLEDSRQDYQYLAKVLIDWNKLHKTDVHGYLVNTSKYQAVNFIPLLSLGTVEFRHLPTTFDAEIIKQWVNIILACKRVAVDVLSQDGYDLGVEFSKRGPRTLLVSLFGEYIKPFLPYYNEARCWAAIDAIQAMQGYARANARLIGWNEPNNKLLMAKAEVAAEVPKKVTTKKKAVPNEQVAQAAQQARFVVIDEFPQFLNNANPVLQPGRSRATVLSDLANWERTRAQLDMRPDLNRPGIEHATAIIARLRAELNRMDNE